MMETAVFGGGCFWCTEAAFKEVGGVEEVTSGYAGGHVEDPTYRQVCSGETGHAEVVKLDFDPAAVTYEELLEVFFSIHDPTQEDRQGPDTGEQYRSIILHTSEKQREKAGEKLEELREKLQDTVYTELKPLQDFYPAEQKHQDYFEKNPEDAYCRIHVKPKVQKVKDKQPEK